MSSEFGTRHSALGVTSVDPQNPWLGLASFTEETRAYFHGRDDEVAELGRRVQRKLLTILFGQSGLGKTSILRAGIVPRLRPEGYCPVYVRVDYGRESPPPAEQIKQAIFRATEAAGKWTKAGASRDGETLWEFLHHRDDTLTDAAGRTLTPLLIFDQFEEIFTLAQSDDYGRERAQSFLKELADLVENRPPASLEARIERDDTLADRFDFSRADYRVLIALREDYLAHLEGLKGLMPSVTQNRLRLARMTGAQALEAVTQPGKALVTDEVARQIVTFVSGASDLVTAEVEPSLLSLVCRELNEVRRAQGRAEISADLLAGSRDTILTEFYERALSDQPPGARHLVEDLLLTDSGYRESVAEERVRKALAAAGAPAETLETLIGRRLLRVEERLDVRRVELTHDVLCGVVRASRDSRREREAKEAAEAELAATRAKEVATQRSLRKSRMVAAVCGLLAGVAAVASVLSYRNLSRARAAEQVAAQARDRAQLSRGEAEKLVTFLLDDLYTQLEPTGRIEIVSGLARRALSYFDALPTELRDARSNRYRAIALSRLGLALAQQGKTLEAEAPLQEAEKLFRGLDHRGIDAVNLATVLRQQSRNAYLQNRLKLATELGWKSVELIDEATKGPGFNAADRVEHARCLMNYGFVLMRDRQNDEAMRRLRMALQEFSDLRSVPEQELRATVLYAEACAWISELGRAMGRAAEFDGLVDDALTVADAAVAREAGNLGALRSRALLRSRKTQREQDSYRFEQAEISARQQAADWVEFLRFDSTNDTARNNHDVAMGNLSGALFRQGRLTESIKVSRERFRELLRRGGSPSTVRGAAFSAGIVANMSAQLGTVAEAEAAFADSVRLRDMAIAQLEPESYFRQVAPAWNAVERARLEVRLGQNEAAMQNVTAAQKALQGLKPNSGTELNNFRDASREIALVQVQVLERQRRWAAAVAPARDLVRGRPTPDDTSPGALEQLATDRAVAAAILARAGHLTEATQLVEQATQFNREIRTAGANDHGRRAQSAMINLARGLLAATVAEKRREFSAGLEEIAAMPPEPQTMRSIRFLREDLQSELAKVAGGS